MDESTLSKQDAKSVKSTEAVALEGEASATEGAVPAVTVRRRVRVRPLLRIVTLAIVLQDKELEKANKKRKRDLLMENLLEDEDGDAQVVRICAAAFICGLALLTRLHPLLGENPDSVPSAKTLG